MSTHQKYRIYLLTVWQEGEQDWRFLLEEPRTGHRRGFTTIQKLISALLETVSSGEPSSDSSNDPDSALFP